MRDEKYIVFKRSEYEQVRREIPVGHLEPFSALEAFQLSDAVVIRKQDVFASAGLATYANCVQVALDVMGVSYPNRTHPYLEDVRDYFFEAATEAHDGIRKLPD